MRANPNSTKCEKCGTTEGTIYDDGLHGDRVLCEDCVDLDEERCDKCTGRVDPGSLEEWEGGWWCEDCRLETQHDWS